MEEIGTCKTIQRKIPVIIQKEGSFKSEGLGNSLNK